MAYYNKPTSPAPTLATPKRSTGMWTDLNKYVTTNRPQALRMESNLAGKINTGTSGLRARTDTSIKNYSDFVNKETADLKMYEDIIKLFEDDDKTNDPGYVPASTTTAPTTVRGTTAVNTPEISTPTYKVDTIALQNDKTSLEDMLNRMLPGQPRLVREILDGEKPITSVPVPTNPGRIENYNNMIALYNKVKILTDNDPTNDPEYTSPTITPAVNTPATEDVTTPGVTTVTGALSTVPNNPDTGLPWTLKDAEAARDKINSQITSDGKLVDPKSIYEFDGENWNLVSDIAGQQDLIKSVTGEEGTGSYLQQQSTDLTAGENALDTLLMGGDISGVNAADMTLDGAGDSEVEKFKAQQRDAGLTWNAAKQKWEDASTAQKTIVDAIPDEAGRTVTTGGKLPYGVTTDEATDFKTYVTPNGYIAEKGDLLNFLKKYAWKSDMYNAFIKFIDKSGTYNAAEKKHLLNIIEREQKLKGGQSNFARQNNTGSERNRMLTAIKDFYAGLTSSEETSTVNPLTDVQVAANEELERLESQSTLFTGF